MVDNLDKILPLLKFESEDDFYYLQILQRKKENPQLGSNSRVIKNYYIKSEEHLINRYNEIFKIEEVIERAEPSDKKIIVYLPSKTGLHLITKPFDLREFSSLYPEIEIHKDNPTNLYIP